MPKPGGAYAAELLGEYIDSEATPLEDVLILEQIIVHRGWGEGPQAGVLARTWLKAFNARAVSIHNEAFRARNFISFTFSPASDSHIQGSCYALPNDSDAVKADKRKRANALPMLEAVRDLSPRDFEFLCGLVLRCFGVDLPNVSESSGDQGVDFYGHVGFGELIEQTTLPGSVEGPIRVWIVGQAKRYRQTNTETCGI